MTEIVPRNEYFIQPIATLDEINQRFGLMKQFIKSQMVEDVDYGTIPGTGSKPSLLKPGAEKLTTLFGLQTIPELIEKVEDWTGKDHGGEPFFFYHYRMHLMKGDLVVGSADGSCNSWEKKYRYRQSEKTCPECGKETIKRSKYDDKGWYCFAKIGGCGAKFPFDKPEITSQQTGPVKNPDVADIVNTIAKMAQKRALVAATLVTANASEFFTQDIEDMDFGVVDVVDVNYVDVSKPAPAKKAKPKGRALEAGSIEAIVKLGLAENDFAATNAIKKSNFTGKVSIDEAVEWMTSYRGARDEGMTSDDAAELANIHNAKDTQAEILNELGY